MSIKFSVTPRNDPRDQNTQPKYYATVRSNGRVDTHGIARDINKMSTVSSITDVRILFQPGKRFKKLINSTEFKKIQE